MPVLCYALDYCGSISKFLQIVIEFKMVPVLNACKVGAQLRLVVSLSHLTHRGLGDHRAVARHGPGRRLNPRALWAYLLPRFLGRGLGRAVCHTAEDRMRQCNGRGAVL
jgi:hypothetical protein